MRFVPYLELVVFGSATVLNREDVSNDELFAQRLASSAALLEQLEPETAVHTSSVDQLSSTERLMWDSHGSEHDGIPSRPLKEQEFRRAPNLGSRRVDSDEDVLADTHPGLADIRRSDGEPISISSAPHAVRCATGLAHKERRCILEAMMENVTLKPRHIFAKCHSRHSDLTYKATSSYIAYVRRHLHMPLAIHDSIVHSAHRMEAGEVEAVVSELRIQHSLGFLRRIGVRNVVALWYRHCVVPLSIGDMNACHPDIVQGTSVWKLSDQRSVIVIQELIAALEPFDSLGATPFSSELRAFIPTPQPTGDNLIEHQIPFDWSVAMNGPSGLGDFAASSIVPGPVSLPITTEDHSRSSPSRLPQLDMNPADHETAPPDQEQSEFTLWLDEVLRSLASGPPLELPIDPPTIPTEPVEDLNNTKDSRMGSMHQVSSRRVDSEEDVGGPTNPVFNNKRVKDAEAVPNSGRLSSSAAHLLKGPDRKGIATIERRCILETLMAGLALSCREVFAKCQSLHPDLDWQKSQQYIYTVRRRLRMPLAIHESIVRSADRIHAGQLLAVITELRNLESFASLKRGAIRKAVDIWYRHCVIPLSNSDANACHPDTTEDGRVWKFTDQRSVIVIREFISELEPSDSFQTTPFSGEFGASKSDNLFADQIPFDRNVAMNAGDFVDSSSVLRPVLFPIATEDHSRSSRSRIPALDINPADRGAATSDEEQSEFTLWLDEAWRSLASGPPLPVDITPIPTDPVADLNPTRVALKKSRPQASSRRVHSEEDVAGDTTPVFKNKHMKGPEAVHNSGRVSSSARQVDKGSDRRGIDTSARRCILETLMTGLSQPYKDVFAKCRSTHPDLDWQKSQTYIYNVHKRLRMPLAVHESIVRSADRIQAGQLRAVTSELRNLSLGASLSGVGLMKLVHTWYRHCVAPLLGEDYSACHPDIVQGSSVWRLSDQRSVIVIQELIAALEPFGSFGATPLSGKFGAFIPTPVPTGDNLIEHQIPFDRSISMTGPSGLGHSAASSIVPGPISFSITTEDHSSSWRSRIPALDINPADHGAAISDQEQSEFTLWLDEAWRSLGSDLPWELLIDPTTIPTETVEDLNVTNDSHMESRHQISSRRDDSEADVAGATNPVFKNKRMRGAQAVHNSGRLSSSASHVIKGADQKGIATSERRCILETLMTGLSQPFREVYAKCRSIHPDLDWQKSKQYIYYVHKRFRMPLETHESIVRSAERIQAGQLKAVVTELRRFPLSASLQGIGLLKLVDIWYRHCVLPLSMGDIGSCHPDTVQGSSVWKLSDQRSVIVIQEFISELE